MGNSSGCPEPPAAGKEPRLVSSPPSVQKPRAGNKVPPPPDEELEERFNTLLVRTHTRTHAHTHTHTHTHTYAHICTHTHTHTHTDI